MWGISQISSWTTATFSIRFTTREQYGNILTPGPARVRFVRFLLVCSVLFCVLQPSYVEFTSIRVSNESLLHYNFHHQLMNEGRFVDHYTSILAGISTATIENDIKIVYFQNTNWWSSLAMCLAANERMWRRSYSCLIVCLHRDFPMVGDRFFSMSSFRYSTTCPHTHSSLSIFGKLALAARIRLGPQSAHAAAYMYYAILLIPDNFADCEMITHLRVWPCSIILIHSSIPN